MQTTPTNFRTFYQHVFLPEHTHPANVALHVLGVVCSAASLPLVVAAGWPWLVLLYPVVHAVPGLLGHRLFERDAAVGDLRVLSGRHPLPWFIAANHLMTWELLRKGFYWRPLRAESRPHR